MGKRKLIERLRNKFKYKERSWKTLEHALLAAQFCWPAFEDWIADAETVEVAEWRAYNLARCHPGLVLPNTEVERVRQQRIALWEKKHKRKVVKAAE